MILRFFLCPYAVVRGMVLGDTWATSALLFRREIGRTQIAVPTNHRAPAFFGPF